MWPTSLRTAGLVLALLVSSACTIDRDLGRAETTGEGLTAQGAPPSRNALPLWEVRDDGRPVAWLAGSVHALPASAYPLPEPLTEAFRASSVLVVEVDVTAHDPAALSALMMRRGMLPGPVLRTKLEVDTWSRLERYLADRNEPLEPYLSLQPWFVTLMLTNAALIELGHRPEHGVDVHFLERAHADGKPVSELESVEFQLGLLADADPHVQDRALVATLADLASPDALKKRIDGLTDAWRRGDLEALHTLALSESARDPALAPLLNALLDERNMSMSRAVRSFIDGGRRPFVLVGALHLAGESGLVAVLGRRYDIRQINAD